MRVFASPSGSRSARYRSSDNSAAPLPLRLLGRIHVHSSVASTLHNGVIITNDMLYMAFSSRLSFYLIQQTLDGLRDTWVLVGSHFNDFFVKYLLSWNIRWFCFEYFNRFDEIALTTKLFSQQIF